MPPPVIIEIILRAVHLLAVGTSLSIPAYCIALDLLPATDSATRVAKRQLIYAATIALILGGLTGLLYGWLIWSPAFQHALWQVGSRLPFGIVEFCFSLILYLVCYASLAIRPRRRLPGNVIAEPELEITEQNKPSENANDMTGRTSDSRAEKVYDSLRRWRLVRAFVLLVAITNLAYHFPLLLGVIHQLEQGSSGEQLSSTEFRTMALSPKILSDSIHFVLASVIMGSQLALGILRSQPVSNRFLRAVIATAFVASIAQWFSGVSAYLWMPRSVQTDLLFWPRWVDLSIMIGAVWVFTVTLIGLLLRPRSTQWYLASCCILGLVLLQMSWMRCH